MQRRVVVYIDRADMESLKGHLRDNALQLSAWLSATIQLYPPGTVPAVVLLARDLAAQWTEDALAHKRVLAEMEAQLAETEDHNEAEDVRQVVEDDEFPDDEPG